MITYRAFDEIIDFITSAPQPEQILSFRPSLSTQNRIEAAGASNHPFPLHRYSRTFCQKNRFRL